VWITRARGSGETGTVLSSSHSRWKQLAQVSTPLPP
jgi:hypothetical protein